MSTNYPRSWYLSLTNRVGSCQYPTTSRHRGGTRRTESVARRSLSHRQVALCATALEPAGWHWSHATGMREQRVRACLRRYPAACGTRCGAAFIGALIQANARHAAAGGVPRAWPRSVAPDHTALPVPERAAPARHCCAQCPIMDVRHAAANRANQRSDRLAAVPTEGS